MNAAQEYADHAEQHAAALSRIAEGDAFLAWFETCLTPEPRPTPLTAKYQARLEGAMLFSAAGQKAGQR